MSANSRHFLRLLRRRWLKADAPLRRDIDSDDLVQEAWATVFQMIKEGRGFADEEEFARLFSRILGNHFLHYHRFRVTTDKRSLKRECECDLEEIAAPGAAPDGRAEAEDECRDFLAGLSERDRALVAAMQDGDMSAVAQGLGMSVRSAQRMWKKLRERWDRRQTSER
jgi:RNA polymerase sigma factor (sigma-70 family)